MKGSVREGVVKAFLESKHDQQPIEGSVLQKMYILNRGISKQIGVQELDSLRV
jgi:hypothetical protein